MLSLVQYMLPLIQLIKVNGLATWAPTVIYFGIIDIVTPDVLKMVGSWRP